MRRAIAGAALVHLAAGCAAVSKPTTTTTSTRTSTSTTGAAPSTDRLERSAIDHHIHVALEHAHAGRTEDALREARAALFHDPRHLYSRMLLGRHLIEVDQARGREVLRDLLAATAALAPEEAVPSADGLSVGQLAAVVRLLLARPEAK